MKKVLSILWRITATLITLIGMGIFFSRIKNKTPPDTLSPTEQVEIIVDQGGCLVCHAGPEYMYSHAQLPVVGTIIQNQAKKAMKFYNVSKTLDRYYSIRLIDEAVLIKMQNVFSKRNMPPLSFRVFFWESPITKGKQEIFLDWTHRYLEREYGYPYPTKEYPFEPILPVPDSLETHPQKVELGRLLYYDPRLSSHSSLSCAFCHKAETAGTDNEPFSIGVYNQPVAANTLTTFNTALHSVFFWNGRSTTLENVIFEHLTDPVKMNVNSLDSIIQVLSQDKELTNRFTEIYSTGLTDSTLADALIQYIKTLLTPNAPFDKYLRGDENAISPEAKEGYALFKNLGCATCHAGVGAGGLSVEYTGTAHTYYPDPSKLVVEDMGHYQVTGDIMDMHRFKVPGLRNINLTYPYFHDAAAQNLRIAVGAMAYHQRNKKLSTKELTCILEFLKTLTGEHPSEPQNIQEKKE